MIISPEHNRAIVAVAPDFLLIDPVPNVHSNCGHAGASGGAGVDVLVSHSLSPVLGRKIF